MRVLVTGATGLLGNNMCRQLLQRGDAVRVLVRQASRRSISLQDLPQVELAVGDVRDSDSLQPAMQDVDGVIHAAGMVYLGHQFQDEIQQINVQGTQNI